MSAFTPCPGCGAPVLLGVPPPVLPPTGVLVFCAACGRAWRATRTGPCCRPRLAGPQVAPWPRGADGTWQAYGQGPLAYAPHRLLALGRHPYPAGRP